MTHLKAGSISDSEECISLYVKGLHQGIRDLFTQSEGEIIMIEVVDYAQLQARVWRKRIAWYRNTILRTPLSTRIMKLLQG